MKICKVSCTYERPTTTTSNAFLPFYKEFQQASHVQQQAQTAAVKGLHTRMETLHQASFQGNQDTQRTIQDLGLQFKQGKPFP